MRSYRATTNISWIGKIENLFEERAAPWAGLKTWPAIAVDQDTASRTKRGEPNLWTHFGKRVRMLACSIRCFEHLVVSNRSGLFWKDHITSSKRSPFFQSTTWTDRPIYRGNSCWEWRWDFPSCKGRGETYGFSKMLESQSRNYIGFFMDCFKKFNTI